MSGLPHPDFASGMIINIRKPKGMTSFDVVRKIRKWTQCKKVGHGGTLDPMAEGVLLVCTGPATKKFNTFQSFPKTYEGIIRLGFFTDTDDAEGAITETKPVPQLSGEDIETVLSSFIGEIEQQPPVYSALKIKGKPAYKLARQGKQVDLKPRTVTIYDAQLLNWKHPDISFKISCGSGTYIRSIARDLAKKLNTGGHLAQLVRTAIGPYALEDAMAPESFKRLLQNEHLPVS